MDNSEVIKKKRGRRKKVIEESATSTEEVSENIEFIIEENNNDDEPNTDTQPVAKKRGRKPKGGKLILKQADTNIKPHSITNVILHLKCSLNDLNDYTDKLNKYVTDPLSYNPSVPPEIMTYDDSYHTGLKYESIESTNHIESMDENKEKINVSYAYTNDNKQIPNGCNSSTNLCCSCKQSYTGETLIENDDDSDINIKDVNTKLKRLKIQLYKNNMHDKKSACFWCTCDFDNLPCYIPKYEMDEQIYGYGSFCRPECATAYLMKENIDDSMKFERYHLLNKIYSKVYDYKKNIKPAPNPYYLLEKFYGNLSIQEYRKLLKTEHMLLVIEKPMTRILPELHEDNEELVLNVYGGNNKTQNTSGVYKVKRESEKQKGPTKTSIIRDKFGLS
jgi:hypothetical protein